MNPPGKTEGGGLSAGPADDLPHLVQSGGGVPQAHKHASPPPSVTAKATSIVLAAGPGAEGPVLILSCRRTREYQGWSAGVGVGELDGQRFNNTRWRLSKTMLKSRWDRRRDIS